MAELRVRPLRSSDRAAVLGELSAWSPALDIAAMLPEPLFTDLPGTSLIALDNEDAVAAVLIAMVPKPPGDLGYIHFVWVSPQLRGGGVARALYQRVFAAMVDLGATHVEAATAAANHGAVEFHRKLGFEVIALPPAPGPAAVLLTRGLP